MELGTAKHFPPLRRQMAGCAAQQSSDDVAPLGPTASGPDAWHQTWDTFARAQPVFVSKAIDDTGFQTCHSIEPVYQVY
jgi:hypothetical protein